MSSSGFRRTVLFRYAFAVVLSVLAALLIIPFRSALNRGIMAPFIAAVMASAWYGGLGTGLLTTGLSVALSAYLFLEPTYSLSVQSADDIAQLIVFSAVAVFVSLLNGAQKRSNALLKANQERTKGLNERLELLVRERTAWLRLLFEITRSANDAQTIEQALLATLPLIGESGDWDYVHAYLASSENSGQFLLSPSFYAKDKDRFALLHQGLAAIPVQRGEGSAGLVAASGELDWVSDLRQDPSSAPALLDFDLRLHVSIPVSAEGEVVAVFECFRTEPSEKNGQVVDLFRTIGTELGLIVERKRLQEGYAEAVWEQQRIIAQELHDGLGQVLAGTGFLSQSLSNQLDEPAHCTLSHRVTEGIEQTLCQIRGLARGVFPIDLNAGGLAAALQQLATSVTSIYSIQCRFEGDSSIQIQDSQTALHLYRMAQEAVANSAKHAKPTEVRIRLSILGPSLCLSIADNGIGIPDPGLVKGGSGLRILRYRASAIGATLSIEGAPGQGTRMVCKVPLAPPSRPGESQDF